MENYTAFIGPLLALFTILAFILGVFIRSKVDSHIADKQLEWKKKLYEKEMDFLEMKKRYIEEETLKINSLGKTLGQNLKSHLMENVDWLTESLRKAAAGISSTSLFAERMQHFNGEKKFIAKSFVPILLKRCEEFIKSDNQNNQVTIFIDSGTTMYAFFEELAKQVSKNYQLNKEWLKKLVIMTNNLQGAKSIMDLGRTNIGNRFSGLAIKECKVIPGEVIPIYFAVLGDEAENALKELKKTSNEKHLIIGITSGNWIRIRNTKPKCPIPLVRGGKHRAFKQILIDSVDEVFVLAPLGKVFIMQTQNEVNKALGLSSASSSSCEGVEYDKKEPYLDLSIGISDSQTNTHISPIKVKLVSTIRPPEFILGKHSRSLEDVFKHDRQPFCKDINELEANLDINSFPHLLIPYDDVPKDKNLQLEIEFPHMQTRNYKFLTEQYGIDINGI